MKTKLLFATMVLPALFAACTNDEIMDSQNPNLTGRALLNPNFSISVTGDADTRFSWNEGSYSWNAFTANDKFSAGLVDNNWTVGDKVLTNYVFSSENNGDYTTTSQMMEGVYAFYSYPEFENNAARGEVPFDLTNQIKTDLNNPAAIVEENQLFVAPLYKLEAATANKSLGIKFISYWSTAAIPVKNVSSQSFKIVRILLKNKAADNIFAVKGFISPTKMNTAKLTYTYSEEAGTYVLPENVDYEKIRTADIANDAATKVNSLMVDCGSYELAAGKTATAYIQVPAGLYEENLEIEVVAEVSEGATTSLKSLKKDVVKNNEGADKTMFNRGKTTAVFGKENATTVAAYEIDDVELISADAADGLYASSYEEVYNYLMDPNAETTVEIYNTGALTVDEKLMTLINRLNKKVKFINPITISTESKAFTALSNIEFTEGATIVKGSIDFGAEVTIPTGKSLTINEGTTAKIGSEATATLFAGKVINNGTLELNGAAATKVENGENATVEVKGDQTIGTDGITTFNTPKTLTVATGKTLTIATGFTMTIDYGQTLKNNGTITATGTLTNNGVIENHGTISAVTNKNLTPIEGTKRIATINNHGILTEVTNSTDGTNGSALIVMKSENAQIVTANSGAGDIDNTMNGFITTPENNIVFAKYTGNQSGKLGNVMKCNKVIVENGTWTNPSLQADVETLVMDGVELTSSAAITFAEQTTVTMKNSSSAKDLTLTAATTVDLTKSTFNGAVTLTAATTPDLTGATFNGAVTLTAATSDTTFDDATFNGALTANATGMTTLTLKGVTLSTVTANNVTAVTIEKTTTLNGAVTIKTGASSALTIKASSTLNVTNDGSIGVKRYTVVTNNGKVTNRGKIEGVTAGSSVGTWVGNAFDSAD